MYMKLLTSTLAMLCIFAGNALAAISFQAPVKYPVAAEPISICIDDGSNASQIYLDVACYAGNQLMWLVGNGDGTFVVSPTSHAATTPTSVSAASFYGWPNKAMAWTELSGIIKWDDGNAQSSIGGLDPKSLCVADFNFDYLPEAAWVDFGSDLVETAHIDSWSGFVSDWSTTVGANPISMCIADFDGDWWPDLAIANYGAQTVTVYRNTSDTYSGVLDFELHATNGVGPHPYSICTADFDLDGFPDLATCDNGWGVTVLRNTGGGYFTASEQGTNRVDSPTCIIAADFDNDGKPDLAVANSASNLNDVTVLRNTSTVGNISFEVGCWVDDWGWAAWALCAADFNRDGKMDLAVANRYSNNVSILLNNTSAGSSTGVCGDANCDLAVDISDAVYLIAYIFSGGPAPCAGCK